MRSKAILIVIALLGASSLHAEDLYHKRGNWLKEHGGQANRPSASCTDCHQASFCSDCHNKRQELLPEKKNPEKPEKTYIHRGDFRTRHAGEARTNPAQCLRCHRTEDCQSCHAREGLTIGVANYPHPASWMIPSSSQFHGKAARQDAALCATCHERGAATNCVACHSTAATSRSPHPRGFKSGLNRQSDPTCRQCH